MLPTPAPDDAGDASLLGPRCPTQKADKGSRARHLGSATKRRHQGAAPIAKASRLIDMLSQEA